MSAGTAGPRATRAELSLLAAFALWSLVPLVLLFAGGDDGLFTGSDGLQTDDHLQYLSWVREASDDVLLSNRFDVVEDPRLFLHPMLALSGLLNALGVSVQLSYLLWKPVTVALLFAGFAAYVRRRLGPDGGARAAALALALFFLTPATVLVDALDVGSPDLQFSTLVIGLEAFAALYPWGGYTGAVAIAMVPIFLLCAERLLEPDARPGRGARAYAAVAGIAGALASWVHPWQGLTILAIVGGLVAWDRFDRRNLRLAVPVALTAAPLLYLFVLSRTDSSWGTVAQPNDSPHLGLWLAIALAPALLALPGLRGPADTVGERLLRLWPLGALAVYFALQQSWFYHAFNGLTLPLAILAVRGWRHWRVPRGLAVPVVLALTLPGLVFAVAKFRETRGAHFLRDDDASALAYLDAAERPGPVLAPQEVGIAVPAFTGRRTWVGHYYWTPDYGARVARARALADGRLAEADAQQVVRESRAAFVLAPCGSAPDAGRRLGPMIAATRRFGCATVYEVRGPA